MVLDMYFQTFDEAVSGLSSQSGSSRDIVSESRTISLMRDVSASENAGAIVVPSSFSGDLRHGRKVILGKGTKTRVIWFPQQFRKDLAPLLQGRKPEDKLIIHTEDYIRTKLRNLKTKLNIKCRLSPHELRRFYARQVYSKTKDIYLVKDLLGHASINTTMHYLKISVSSISRRMSRIVDW